MIAAAPLVVVPDHANVKITCTFTSDCACPSPAQIDDDIGISSCAISTVFEDLHDFGLFMAQPSICWPDDLREYLVARWFHVLQQPNKTEDGVMAPPPSSSPSEDPEVG